MTIGMDSDCSESSGLPREASFFNLKLLYATTPAMAVPNLDFRYDRGVQNDKLGLI